MTLYEALRDLLGTWPPEIADRLEVHSDAVAGCAACDAPGVEIFRAERAYLAVSDRRLRELEAWLLGRAER